MAAYDKHRAGANCLSPIDAGLVVAAGSVDVVDSGQGAHRLRHARQPDRLRRLRPRDRPSVGSTPVEKPTVSPHQNSVAGGPHVLTNVRPSCTPCNQRKSRTIDREDTSHGELSSSGSGQVTPTSRASTPRPTATTSAWHVHGSGALAVARLTQSHRRAAPRPAAPVDNAHSHSREDGRPTAPDGAARRRR